MWCSTLRSRSANANRIFISSVNRPHSVELFGDVFKALQRAHEDSAVFRELLCQQLLDQAFKFALQGDLEPSKRAQITIADTAAKSTTGATTGIMAPLCSDKRGVR